MHRRLFEKAAGAKSRLSAWRMIRKSGNRFSEEIMLG
jgi:hypothetical protein